MGEPTKTTREITIWGTEDLHWASGRAHVSQMQIQVRLRWVQWLLKEEWKHTCSNK